VNSHNEKVHSDRWAGNCFGGSLFLYKTKSALQRILAIVGGVLLN
jgi:hypothetical protein